MAWLSPKNKDKLVGGLIGIIILTLGYMITNWFKKEPKKSNGTTQLKIISNNLSDSATQTNSSNVVTQKNENKGDVLNDFSKDKKVTNQYFKAEKTKPETNIVNNGFLNQGGQGNTYNQTIKGKEQRHFKPEYMDWVLANIPKEYSLKTLCAFGDAESELFAKEIVEKIKSLGYKIEFGGWAVFSNSQFGKVDFIKTDSSKTIKINVYSNVTN